MCTCMRNTIQICYCYFNLQSSLSTDSPTRTAHWLATLCTRTLLFHFISFIYSNFFSSSLSSYLGVCVCVCLRQYKTGWTLNEKKRSQIVSSSLSLFYVLWHCKIDATVGSLYALRKHFIIICFFSLFFFIFIIDIAQAFNAVHIVCYHLAPICFPCK